LSIIIIIIIVDKRRLGVCVTHGREEKCQQGFYWKKSLDGVGVDGADIKIYLEELGWESGGLDSCGLE